MRAALIAAACLAFAAPALAQTDPFAGRWTWNAAQSTYTPPDPHPDRSETLTVTRADTHFAASFDAVAQDGQSYRLSWDAPVDGPPAPLQGGSPGDTIQVRREAPGRYGFAIVRTDDRMTRTCTARASVMTCEGSWTVRGQTYTFKETWTRS
jgi:hypothetical protein